MVAEVRGEHDKDSVNGGSQAWRQLLYEGGKSINICHRDRSGHFTVGEEGRNVRMHTGGLTHQSKWCDKVATSDKI